MFTLTELEDAAALIGRTLAPRRNAPGRRSAEHSILTFVRNAWVLLGFQLLAAAAALVVTAWAALQV